MGKKLSFSFCEILQKPQKAIQNIYFKQKITQNQNLYKNTPFFSVQYHVFFQYKILHLYIKLH